MDLRLKKIEIKNFKSFASEEFVFDLHYNRIEGKNGTGKSTIYDAYMWCLYGCNSENESRFLFSPIGADEGITTSVAVTIADGTTYERRYCKGKYEYLISGDKVKASEYKSRIIGGVPQSVVECISSVWAIPSLSSSAVVKIMIDIYPSVIEIDREVFSLIEKENKKKTSLQAELANLSSELSGMIELSSAMGIDAEKYISAKGDAIADVKASICECEEKVEKYNTQAAGVICTILSFVSKGNIEWRYENGKVSLLYIGVPYSSLNRAKKMQCGVEICERLQCIVGITAPVFIDNAECATGGYQCGGQLVEIRATDSELNIVR